MNSTSFTRGWLQHSVKQVGKNIKFNWYPATPPPWLAAPNRRQTSQNVALNRYFPWALAEARKTIYRRQNLVSNQQQRRSSEKGQRSLSLYREMLSTNIIFTDFITVRVLWQRKQTHKQTNTNPPPPHRKKTQKKHKKDANFVYSFL